MKISFVVQDLVGQGVQYATAIIAREFSRMGWSVDVLVSQVHKRYLQEGKIPFALPEAVNLVYMPSRRGSRNCWFVRHYLRNCGSDVLIAESGIYTWCVRWASIGMTKKKLPRLVQVNHGNTNILAGWRLWKKCMQFYFLYGKFSALLFVNKESERNFRMMFGSLRNLRVATVNNAGVDDVSMAKAKLSPLHPWLLDKKCPTLVTAGSYTPGKCHLMLMEAMQIAIKERRVRLIIYGRGYLESKYHEFVKERGLGEVVSIAGFTGQLPAEINASDGLISSSNEESFGITIVEALSCGKPVISTDAPYGPREILADGKYGRLVPMNDAGAMARAIIDLADGKISSPPEESWMRYTIENTMKKYLIGIGVENPDAANESKRYGEKI